MRVTTDPRAAGDGKSHTQIWNTHDGRTATQKFSPANSSIRRHVSFLGTLFVAFLTLGLPYSFGTFYVVLLEQFRAPRWETTLVQSVFVGVSTGAGFPVSILIHRYGVRATMAVGSVLSFLGMFSSWFATSIVHLILTIGIVTGFGGCMSYMSAIVIASSLFREKEGPVLATISAMSGLGPVVLPLLLDLLQLSFGVRGAFLLCSAVYLHIVLVASVIKQETEPAVAFGTQHSLCQKLSRLRNTGFVFYCIASVVCTCGFNVIMVVVVDFAESRGLSEETGINYILISNALVTIAAIGIGILKLFIRINGAIFFCLGCFVAGSGILLLPFIEGNELITTCLVLYGIGFGSAIGMQSVAVYDLVGQDSLAIGYGVRGLLIGIGNPIAAVTTGWLFDFTGSYAVPFMCLSLTCMSSCLPTMLWVTAGSLLRRRRVFVNGVNE